MVPAENCKLVTVESCQSLIGAQPEITIAGLSNGADGVLRKALLLRPDGYRVLRERLVGIEGHGGVNPAEKHQQSAYPQHRRILCNSFAAAVDDPFGSLYKSSDCSNIAHIDSFCESAFRRRSVFLVRFFVFGLRPVDRCAIKILVGGFSMKKYSVVLIAGLSLLAGALPVMAHHSFAAEYDSSKPVTISGTVTKVEWMNPHARFYVDVKGADGKVTNWNFELGAIPVLLKQGWRKDSLKEGDQVTVEGSRAKDGSFSANARRVSLPDGRRVFAGSSAPSADQ